MRGHLRYVTLLALLSGVLGLSSSASAQSITFMAEGTVTVVHPDLAGAFSPGDAFHVEYTFESTTADLDPRPGAGRYMAITDLSAQIGGYTASASGGSISIDFDLSGRDAYQFTAVAPPVGSLQGTGTVPDPYRINALLGLATGPGGSVFTSDALPTVPPDPADFEWGHSLALIFENPLNREKAAVIADWTEAWMPGGGNAPPECSGATASESLLWPPNHKFAPLTVSGVTDPDGDSVSTTVTGVFQDEPVSGNGSGRTAPDGVVGAGGDMAHVRAERLASGDGRVYHLSFTADDGNGGTCTGEVTVAVPHDRDHWWAVDGGALFDSTAS